MTWSVGRAYDWDEVHDGDSGLIGVLLYGDVDDRDVELFLAAAGDELGDPFYEGGDFNLEPCWVRKLPRGDGWSDYAYTDTPGRGAKKCLRIELKHGWERWCHRHIYEPAQSGIPVEQFTVDSVPWPLVRDGCLYLCRDCARDHHERVEAARDEHMLPWYAQQATLATNTDQMRAIYADSADRLRARIAARAARAA